MFPVWIVEVTVCLEVLLSQQLHLTHFIRVKGGLVIGIFWILRIFNNHFAMANDLIIPADAYLNLTLALRRRLEQSGCLLRALRNPSV